MYIIKVKFKRRKGRGLVIKPDNKIKTWTLKTNSVYNRNRTVRALKNGNWNRNMPIEIIDWKEEKIDV